MVKKARPYFIVTGISIIAGVAVSSSLSFAGTVEELTINYQKTRESMQLRRRILADISAKKKSERAGLSADEARLRKRYDELTAELKAQGGRNAELAILVATAKANLEAAKRKMLNIGHAYNVLFSQQPSGDGRVTPEVQKLVEKLQNFDERNTGEYESAAGELLEHIGILKADMDNIDCDDLGDLDSDGDAERSRMDAIISRLSLNGRLESADTILRFYKHKNPIKRLFTKTKNYSTLEKVQKCIESYQAYYSANKARLIQKFQDDVDARERERKELEEQMRKRREESERAVAEARAAETRLRDLLRLFPHRGSGSVSGSGSGSGSGIDSDYGENPIDEILRGLPEYREGERDADRQVGANLGSLIDSYYDFSTEIINMIGDLEDAALRAELEDKIARKFKDTLFGNYVDSQIKKVLRNLCFLIAACKKGELIDSFLYLDPALDAILKGDRGISVDINTDNHKVIIKSRDGSEKIIPIESKKAE